MPPRSKELRQRIGLTASLCIIGWLIAVVACVAAYFAFSAALEFYKRSKLLAAFPSHQEIYASANEQIDKKSRPRIILFGDSRVEQWNPLPDLPNSEILNRGAGGETTSQMRLRFDSDVLDLQPDTIIIQAGINDLVAAILAPAEAPRIVENVIANFEWFIAKARAAQIKVILTTIVHPAEPDILRRIVWSDSISQHVKDVNTAILRLSNTTDVTVVDADRLLTASDTVLRAPYVRDVLHWNRNAYIILNNRLIEIW